MAIHLRTRVIGFTLVGVLLGMAAFAVWQRRDAESQLDAIRDAQAVGEAYTTAHVEMLALEKALLLWAAQPETGTTLRVVRYAESYAAALNRLVEIGDAEDRAFAQALLDNGEAIAPILVQLLESPDPAAAYVELEPQLKDVYESLIAELDPEMFAEYQASAAGDWDIISPLAMLIDRRATAERTNTAALINGVEQDWDNQTPFVVSIYAAGTALVFVLMTSTLLIGRREAMARAEVESLRRAVTTDPLTGLGNRRGFEEALKLATSDVAEGTDLCLAIMDLDEFKEANDTFGHDRGDSILRAFAQLLSSATPDGVESYRIGGDEFALVLHGFAPGMAVDLLNVVRARAREALGNGVTVSAGVARLKDDEALLRQEADAALYEAKLRGRNLVVLYHDDGHSQPLFPAAKLAAVRQLLIEGNVRALFQPIWDLHESRLLAFEGLSRPDERYGLAGPQQAFEIAEKFGRAADMDRICRLHILEAASALPAEADIFINLSPYTLTHQSFDPAHLIGEILRAGIDPGRVVYEITERSQVAPDAIAEGVRMLRQAGFRVALDDVGAGNNGLEMLRKVEFDFVKVDRDVVIEAQQSGTGRAALMAILAFASESQALVVAEGVEDEAMFGLVKEVAHSALRGTPGLIHGVQGYLFGRPAEATASANEPPATLAAA